MFASETETASNDTAWWVPTLKDAELHKKLKAAVLRVRQSASWRKQAQLQHLRLYGNAPILGFGIANYTKPAALSGGSVGLNIIRSCSDALTAKLCTDEMKPRLLTNGATWDLQQRAKELEKFIDGQVLALEVNEKLPGMVLQCCIFGTGILKIYTAGEGKYEKIYLDSIPTWAMLVDDQEALYGNPPSFYQRMWYDRSRLRAMFKGNPEAQRLIDGAKLQVDEDLDQIGYQATADQVLVTEAWHLPSAEGMGDDCDGCHAMQIENGLLYRERYEHSEPPFIFYSLWPQPLGFFGVGIAQQLQGLQIELNVLMRKVQRSFHLLGAGHWLIDKSSKINKHKIDNEIGSIWEYMGKPPELIMPEPVAEQIFAHMDRIYTRSFEVTGISQLEASSLKPKGLNSGVAIDSYLDITTERFNVSQRRLRNAFLKLCKWILRLAGQIAERNPEFGVLVPEENHASMIHFKKNELEEDKYLMKLYATNELADDPSEKMEQVEQMVNAGWIDNQTARRLIDFPDLEEFENLDLSGYNAVERCISAALKDGKYIGPEKFLPIGTTGNPGPAIKQVQNALVRAWSKGAPDDRLKLLKQWIADAVSLMPAPPPPPAPAAPMPPGVQAPSEASAPMSGAVTPGQPPGAGTGEPEEGM